MPNYKVFNETALLARGPTGIHKTNDQTLIFTNVTVWTPASGKRVRLYGGMVSANGTTTITVKFGTTTSIATLYLAINSTVDFTIPTPLEGAVDQIVSWSGTAAVSASITLFGEEV